MSKFISLTLFLVGIKFYSLGQPNVPLFNITYSQQISHEEYYDKELQKAVESLSRFLFYRDKSLINNANDLDTNYINFVCNQLFLDNYLENKYMSYFIFGSKKIQEVSDQYTISFLLKHDFSLYGDDFKNEFFLYYIYEANLVKDGEKYFIDLSPRYDVIKKAGTITYFYSNDAKPNKKAIMNAKKFLNNLATRYKFIQEKELNYFLNPRKDAFFPFGFTYNISITSMFLKNSCTLISTNNDEDNLHELTHYYFQDFNMGEFLSEGIAVYYGGSNGVSQKIHLENELVLFNALDDTVKNSFVSDFLASEFYGGDYQPLFYALAGALISEYLIIHNELELLDIIKNNGTINPKDFIKKHLKKENPEEYLWKILN